MRKLTARIPVIEDEADLLGPLARVAARGGIGRRRSFGRGERLVTCYVGGVRRHRARSANRTVHMLTEAVSRFRGSGPQGDDITVLALRWLGEPAEKIPSVLGNMDHVHPKLAALPPSAGRR